jgi:hypothetical protein
MTYPYQDKYTPRPGSSMRHSVRVKVKTRNHKRTKTKSSPKARRAK